MPNHDSLLAAAEGVAFLLADRDEIQMLCRRSRFRGLEPLIWEADAAG